MSQESIVRTTMVKSIVDHPNANKLSILLTYDNYPVIVKRGEHFEGQYVTYIPVDTLVPLNGEFSWLSNEDNSYYRVKAKKIRGIFSMGLVCRYINGTNIGDDVSGYFGAKKYESQIEILNNESLDETPKVFVPHYDIEGWRKYGSEVFCNLNEEVIITEKIHGANSCFVWSENRLRIRSRTQWKLFDNKNSWAKAASNYQIAEICKEFGEGIVIFAELIGVQDLKYGFTSDLPGIAVFDIYDANRGQWIDYDKMISMISNRLPVAPELYRGPLNGIKIQKLSDGESKILNANHIREGFVIKPVINRFSLALNGRAILKFQSENYLMR